MTLQDTIRQALEDCDPLEANDCIAGLVADRYHSLSAYREATWALLIDEVRRVRSMERREAQAPIFAAIIQGKNNGGGRITVPVDERTRWLRNVICVPGRDPVTVAEATVEDHQAYIDYLAKMRAGLNETITVHRDAIQQIRKAGVTCLAEVERVAA